MQENYIGLIIMGISYVLDIVIGLFFIYLIASLLASEIQELITTILQWRSIHIKQSIEGLLSGNKITGEEFEKAKKLTDEIYNNPVIKDLNHETKGNLGWFWNGIVQWCAFFGIFSKTRSKGYTSGPSYISNQVFSSSFLETLQIQKLTILLTKLKLEMFIEKRIKQHKDYRKIIASNEFLIFNHKKQEILLNYEDGILSFSDILDAIAREADSITVTVELANSPPVNVKLINCIFTSGSVDSERELLIKNLIPSLLEVIRLILFYRHLEIHKSAATPPKINIIARQELDTKYPYLKGYINRHDILWKYKYGFEGKSVTNADNIKEEINKILSDELPNIPDTLKEGLYKLTSRSLLKTEQIEKQLQHFQTEIEDWFNQSMDRASGVYKRNAKLVAVLIGFVIAWTCNIDSLHVVNRISQDQALRDSLNISANTIVVNGKTLDKETIEQLKSASKELSLPIGWQESNVNQTNVKSSEKNPSVDDKNSSKNGILQMLRETGLLTLAGWIISAIAISMGSSFWFDLLGKFINVKNIGKIPNPNSSSSSSSSNSSSGSSSSSSSNSSS